MSVSVYLQAVYIQNQSFFACDSQYDVFVAVLPRKIPGYLGKQNQADIKTCKTEASGLSRMLMESDDRINSFHAIQVILMYSQG